MRKHVPAWMVLHSANVSSNSHTHIVGWTDPHANATQLCRILGRYFTRNMPRPWTGIYAAEVMSDNIRLSSLTTPRAGLYSHLNARSQFQVSAAVMDFRSNRSLHSCISTSTHWYWSEYTSMMRHPQQASQHHLQHCGPTVWGDSRPLVLSSEGCMSAYYS